MLDRILIQNLSLLVPHETSYIAGLCVLIIALLTWLSVTSLDLIIFKKLESQYKNLHIGKMLFDQAALLP